MNGKAFFSSMLASGGDKRIFVPYGQNSNCFGASRYPRMTFDYASSAVNNIALTAFIHLETLLSDWPAGRIGHPAFYTDALNRLASMPGSAVSVLDGSCQAPIEGSTVRRISSSMTLIVELSARSTEQLQKRFHNDTARIAGVLKAASRLVAA